MNTKYNPGLALRVAGIVFLLVSLAHLARILLHISLHAGTLYVPLRASALGFLLTLLLAIWMFAAASKK